MVQQGIDTWAMALQRKYNKLPDEHVSSKHQPSKAVIYNTYQAYLRSTPSTLARHLEYAAGEGFVLGVKLVRGAYLASDPRELMWNTKAETDSVYDALASSLIRRQYDGLLVRMPSPGGKSLPEEARDPPFPFPEVNLVLATHNLLSARKALALRSAQAAMQQPRIEMVYGQLMGMADHMSCELVVASKAGSGKQGQTDNLGKYAQDVGRECFECPRTCKYLVWGSVSECAKYLVRRAEENRDAVTRTVEARKALGKELWRRVWGI